MTKLLTKLLDLPYWIAALLLGALLVALPCVTIEKDHSVVTHPPNPLILLIIGVALLLLSSAAFIFKLVQDHKAAAGIDLTRVREDDGALLTTVGNCEIRVVYGHIEDYTRVVGSAIALPCNEYFDDKCAYDTRSALGAYVKHAFEEQVEEFVEVAKEEARKKLGPGTEQQKTADERAMSFGAGRCVLLIKPLGRSVPVALVSTTTQRVGPGLAGRISYTFEAIRELVACLADARLNEVIMPVLGAGHGGMDPPLAFVGLLLAIAEAARYGPGAQRLKKVTVVVYRRDESSPALVDPIIVRRALALVGSRE